MIKIKKIQHYQNQLKDQEQVTPNAFFQHTASTDKTIKRSKHSITTLKCMLPKETQKNITDHLISLRTETPFQKQLIQCSIFEKQKPKTGFKKTRSNESHKTQSLEPEMAKKRNKWFELQDIITNQKVKALKHSFIQKLKRNNPFTEPVQFQTSNYMNSNSILDHKGFQLPEIADQIFSIIYILDIMASLFMYTLALVFPEVAEQTQLLIFQIFSLTVLISEMIISFLQMKMVYGRKVQTLREISRWYIHNHFFIDLVNILATILAISTKIWVFSFLRLLGLYKISQLFEKLQKLEIYIIQNYYNEQYWSLIKTLIFNFCFAHFLAILLIIMTEIDPRNNWMVVKRIENAYWGERYVWSYYWGINIMLTVGFGDIVATTYQEALCLIFIETISCLALAYNINCIGNLIANIRAQDIEKSKNFKIFKKMVDKSKLPQELNQQINNYIHESINVKKKFNLQQEKNFVEKLPHSFKTQVLRQSNKNIFQNLTFFHNLVQKTLFSLAQKIQMVITHPEETIQPLQDKFNLLILKAGEIGYICKKPGSSYNNKIIDTVKINGQDNPFLINLNFITKKRQCFQIKSIVYSMIYFLEHEKLIQIFKESQMDYQLYAYLRDKNKYILDQFQVLKCDFCKTKHTKFQCPRIHFIPIHMHVINKWRHSYQISKNSRIKTMRYFRQGSNSLALFKYLQDQHFGTTFIRQKNINNTNKHNNMQKFFQIKRRRQKSLYDSKENQRKQDLMFIEQTTEIIKQQLTKLLGAEQYQDETWNLQLDRMKNFKGYFSSDNPNSLKEKFSLKKRLQLRGIQLESSMGQRFCHPHDVLKSGPALPSFIGHEYTLSSELSREGQS